MLLHNSASVLNPAGYYLFLGGAAYPPIAYYIETPGFQGEVLQGGKATSMHTHMHTLSHLDGQRSESCLSTKISDLPFKMNWTGRTVFPFGMIFFGSPQIFSGGICAIAGSVFPSQAHIQTQSQQCHASSLAEICLE